MPHTNGATRHTLSPNQLALIEGTAGWRNPSPRAEAVRERALRVRRRLQAELDALRDEIEAEREILASIIQAQQTALAEIKALAKQKPMAIDELADELHHLLNPEPTDNPHNIAKRLGYANLENLILRLRRNDLDDLAEQLKKPLKKPPAPYPSHQWRTRKPTPNQGQE